VRKFGDFPSLDLYKMETVPEVGVKKEFGE
jgi:hypothetical protein